MLAFTSLQARFYRDLFHRIRTLYQVRYWASLLHQKIHKISTGYVMDLMFYGHITYNVLGTAQK